jgi:hypothetical protein
MTILTIEALRINPWNVVTSRLPAQPDQLLLEVAVLAADYCRTSEFVIVKAARLGLFEPAAWDQIPDLDERWLVLEEAGATAHDIYRELIGVYCRMFNRLPD